MFGIRKAAKTAALATMRRNMGSVAASRVLVHDAQFDVVGVEDFLRSSASLAKNFEDRRSYYVHYNSNYSEPEFPQPTGLATMLAEGIDCEIPNEHDNKVAGWNLFFVSIFLLAAYEWHAIGWKWPSLEDMDNFEEVARKEKIFSMSIGKRYQDIE